MRAREMKVVIGAKAARSPAERMPQPVRSTPCWVESRMPSVGLSDVPPTTILARLRKPWDALVMGGSQTASGQAARTSRACAILAASWTS
ncbi:hypothetical protein D3C87_1915950 [compost metagenome]